MHGAGAATRFRSAGLGSCGWRTRQQRHAATQQQISAVSMDAPDHDARVVERIGVCPTYVHAEWPPLFRLVTPRCASFGTVSPRGRAFDAAMCLLRDRVSEGGAPRRGTERLVKWPTSGYGHWPQAAWRTRREQAGCLFFVRRATSVPLFQVGVAWSAGPLQWANLSGQI